MGKSIAGGKAAMGAWDLTWIDQGELGMQRKSPGFLLGSFAPALSQAA